MLILLIMKEGQLRYLKPRIRFKQTFFLKNVSLLNQINLCLVRKLNIYRERPDRV